MGMEGTGLTVADALALQDRRDGMFGDGNGAWIFFLFFLLAFGGNGYGFGGNGVGTTGNFINNDFLYTNLKNTIDMGFNQNANQNFAIQKDMCQGFNGVQAAIAQQGYQSQMCCCETNRNIDAVRYENAKNTCDITSAIHAEGEATRALINSNTMQELRDQLQAAQLQLGQLSQTQTLIDQLRPCARPAYITCSPYQAANYPYGYNGCGNCTGC